MWVVHDVRRRSHIAIGLPIITYITAHSLQHRNIGPHRHRPLPEPTTLHWRAYVNVRNTTQRHASAPVIERGCGYGSNVCVAINPSPILISDGVVCIIVVGMCVAVGRVGVHACILSNIVSVVAMMWCVKSPTPIRWE